MSTIRTKAREYREYGPYDRFISRRVGVGRHFVSTRYVGTGRRWVPLLAYEARRLFAVTAECFQTKNKGGRPNDDD
jgi:hypothetical protein